MIFFILWTWFHNTFIRQKGDPKRAYIRAYRYRFK